MLESLFHRFLLCSAPQNRHDAIKVAKEVGKEVCEVIKTELESLFHRFLLCPAPQNRHDAIKVVKEVGTEVCEVIKTSVRFSFP